MVWLPLQKCAGSTRVLSLQLRRCGCRARARRAYLRRPSRPACLPACLPAVPLPTTSLWGSSRPGHAMPSAHLRNSTAASRTVRTTRQEKEKKSAPSHQWRCRSWPKGRFGGAYQRNREKRSPSLSGLSAFSRWPPALGCSLSFQWSLEIPQMIAVACAFPHRS